jgi:hypothetical protein
MSGINTKAEKPAEITLPMETMPDLKVVPATKADHRNYVLSKPLPDCTIDEIIMYRTPEIFYNDEKRAHSIPVYADVKVYRALDMLTKVHTKTQDYNNRYIAIMLGYYRLCNKHQVTITGCQTLYNLINDSDDDDKYSQIRSKTKIPVLTDNITEFQTCFALANYQSFIHLAKWIGLTETAILLSCFWYGVIDSDSLNEHLKKHGNEYIAAFERKLQLRYKMLNNLADGL